MLYWLSGLTCTDENFVQKAGAQQYAAKHGVAIVAPDTSPRGDGVPDDPEAAYDFGLGAGFYVNATQAPWSRHYRMYDYVVNELPQLVTANLPHGWRTRRDFRSLHGRPRRTDHRPEESRPLSLGLRLCAHLFAAATVPGARKHWAIISATTAQAWKQYDTTELVRSAKQHLPVLVDQGDADNFLATATQDGTTGASLRRRPLPDERCACRRATTTAISLSPRSSASILNFTRSSYNRPAQQLCCQQAR